MDGLNLALIAFAILIFFMMIGVPIIIGLGVSSVIGIGLLTGSLDISLSILATTAFSALRDYIFAVIPLFILMGEFVSRSGAAADLYVTLSRLLHRLPGRLAVATVWGNAVFAAVVGVSVASAAAFSRIAYPAMCKAGYKKSVSAGCIAGSASLGMLIPPSILMIVWGLLTQESISSLFLAGVIPGLILALMYSLFCVLFALAKPEYFGIGQARLNSLANKDVEKDFIPPVTINELIGTFGCIALIGLVIGGIWFGVFTPTEGAGMGALFGLLLALIKGMRLTGLLTVIAETAKVSAPILCLLIFAQMYSRLLALSGTGEIIRAFVADSGLSPELVLAAMFLIWFVLGMFVDSVSIILLTVPIFAPIAIMLGIEPIAFALIGILVIEAGIITPPFGLVVYSVRGCISDPSVSLTDIFKSAIPYWVMLMVLAVMVYQWPGLATWLPSI